MIFTIFTITPKFEYHSLTHAIFLTMASKSRSPQDFRLTLVKVEAGVIVFRNPINNILYRCEGTSYGDECWFTTRPRRSKPLKSKNR